MATSVLMKNESNGLIRKGFYGFSWTYLFFSGLVPIFRGEVGIGALHIVLSMLTLGISNIIFCFLYNKQYTQRLLEKGFKFADRDELNMAASVRIGVDLSVAGLKSAA